MYIPLGGRKHQFINSWLIFTYVAIWHEFSFSLLIWAYLIIFGITLEITIKPLI